MNLFDNPRALELTRRHFFAAGSHPLSRPEEQAIVPEERYLAFVEYADRTSFSVSSEPALAPSMVSVALHTKVSLA